MSIMTIEQRQILSELSASLGALREFYGNHIRNFDEQIINAKEADLSLEDAIRDYVEVKSRFQLAIQTTADAINLLIEKT